jgi:hypothetical protein
LGGKMTVRITPPLQLVDEPQHRVSDADLKAATERLAQACEPLVYGPGGVDAWQGPISLRGSPLDAPPELPLPDVEPRPVPADDDRPMVVSIGSLLWRCPICHAPEALSHTLHWFRSDEVRCRACDTTWEIRRVPEKDFCLVVTDGPPEVVGLDMALSRWYDEMKRGLDIGPVVAADASDNDDEEVYLEREGVSLLPYQPNPLFDDWADSEAPRKQPGRREMADYDSIGTGTLSLTNRCLIWRSEEREIVFYWESVTSAYLWAGSTLVLGYGTAMYRLGLRQAAGLRWLTYVGVLAQQANAPLGRTVKLPRY